MFLQMSPDLINLILLAGFFLKALDLLIRLVFIIIEYIFNKVMIRPENGYTLNYSSLMMHVLLNVRFLFK